MASKRIAGITIEIGGDTTKLNNALKGVDKQLASTQSKLRDVNKLLKLDPGNTELLTQKQKLLKDAIDTTSERLKTLKSVTKESVSPEEWDALQREIVATESDLENLKKEMKDFGSVSEQKCKVAGDKIKAVGDKISSVGTSLTKKVTVPIVAVGAAAVKAFDEVDKGLDIVAEKTGKTGKELEGMGKIMKEIAQEIPTDFETAGEAVGEVSTRFDVQGDKLKSLSTLYVKFAKINKTDVTTSVDQSQKALAAFGLSADDAEGYLDILTKTAQNTGVSIDTLMTGAVQNGTAFQEMGLSIDQATVFMGQMEKSGANSETVMNGLRKALKSATQQGIPLNKALGDLQDTIENGTDSTDGLTEAYKLFGRSGDQIYAAVKNGTLDFKDLADASEDAGGTVTKTFEATLSPSDKFTVALNSIKILGADIAKQVMPILAKVLEKIRDVVVNLTNKWNSLSDSQKDMILKIAGIAAAVGPVLLVIGKLVSTVGTVITAFGTFSTAAQGLSGIIGAGGPVVLAITAAIAAGVLIYKNWDKIKSAAAALKKKLSNVFKSIKKTITKTWEDIKKAVSKAWDAIKSAVSGGVDKVKTAISKGFDKVKTTVSSVWTNIKSGASKGWEAIRTAVSNGSAKIKDSVSTRMTAVKTTMSNAWNAVKTGASKAWENIRVAASNGAKTVHDSVSGRMSTIKESISSAWDKVKTTVSNKLSSIATSASTTFSNVRNSITNAFKNVSITNPFTKLVNAAKTAINSVKSLFRVKLKFPSITLPHFKITGKFSLKPPSVPKISIQWYKKAYDNPLLFTSPTVLQTGKGLKGFGDGSGGELVYGRNQLMKDIAKASGAGATYTINVYGTDGMNVNQLADAVQNRLVALQKQRELACV